MPASTIRKFFPWSALEVLDAGVKQDAGRCPTRKTPGLEDDLQAQGRSSGASAGAVGLGREGPLGGRLGLPTERAWPPSPAASR